MKIFFLTIIVLLIVSCDNVFNENQNCNSSNYFICTINPDGSENEKLIQLETYPFQLKVSLDGQKILAYKSNQFELINLIDESIKSFSSDVFVRPTFSNDSMNLVYVKQDKLMLYNINSNETDSLMILSIDRSAIFSPDDESIIFTTISESEDGFINSLKKINVDGSNLMTLYSYVSGAYGVNKIQFPLFSGPDKLYFLANGILHTVNIDGSNHIDLDVSIGSGSFDISPNMELLVGSSEWNCENIRLISPDGMDSYQIFSGENASFISNQQIVYSRSNWDLWIGEWTGGIDNHKLIKGRYPDYCQLTNKIYYLKVECVHE